MSKVGKELVSVSDHFCIEASVEVFQSFLRVEMKLKMRDLWKMEGENEPFSFVFAPNIFTKQN